jgi:hypothetical protein
LSPTCGMCAEILNTGTPSVAADSLLFGHLEERRLVRLADEAAARAPEMEMQLKKYIAKVQKAKRATVAEKQATEVHLRCFFGYVRVCQMLYKDVEEQYLPKVDSAEGSPPPPPEPHEPEMQRKCCEEAALAVYSMAKLVHDSMLVSGMSEGSFEGAIDAAWDMWQMTKLGWRFVNDFANYAESSTEDDDSEPAANHNATAMQKNATTPKARPSRKAKVARKCTPKAALKTKAAKKKRAPKHKAL